jgi:1,4-dihydroxy-2-naphthoate octaprenyltransferase
MSCDLEQARPRPSRLSVGIAAARPLTLTAAVTPVLVGLALAARSGHVDAMVAAVTMAAAVLIQIGTNVANDYYDFVAGTDTAGRLGPLRVTQTGLARPQTVKRAAFATLGIAALLGLYLVRAGGLPILIIGLLSLVAALAYSTGPWPLGYRGLGDAFVFVFFGLAAVNGTFFLQSREVTLLSMLSSIPIACLVTAILVVNNLRDIETDRAAGKRTLAARLGRELTQLEYFTLVAAAFLIAPVLWWCAGWRVLLVAGALPLALHEVRGVNSRSGRALNQSLGGTARLHMVYGVLLSLALLR